MSNLNDYETLIAQREELDKQIAQARAAAVAQAVATVREIVTKFGLSQEEVFGARTRRVGSASKTSTVAPKYRNPATGQTWTGRGKPPAWIKDQDREQFAI